MGNPQQAPVGSVSASNTVYPNVTYAQPQAQFNYPGALALGGQPPGQPPHAIDLKSWLGIIGVAVTVALTVLGGGIWLHANIGDRVERLEAQVDRMSDRVDAKIEDNSDEIVKIRIELEKKNKN